MVVRVVRVVLVLLVLAVPLAAQSLPPQNLKLVGDHWTPYDPPDPATFPAESTVHIIVPGDTLWDLAAHYYGDPYLWPQLWENNTYITDAHWIYPGDPLLVGREIVPTDAMTTPSELAMDDAEDDDTIVLGESDRRSAPVPLGSLSDVYCYGYLGEIDEVMPNYVFSFEDTELKYVPGALTQDLGVVDDEVIYVAGGTSSGILAGETYIVVKSGDLVRHPRTGEVLGRHYNYKGQIRILCADETSSTAIVTQACVPINVGDRLKPVPQIAIPLARVEPLEPHCKGRSGKAEGTIVNAKDYYYNLGEGAVIQIDMGWEDFLQPGDFLTVYRENLVPGQPRQILGEVGILTAEPHTSTAKIVQMRYAMRVGDRVELK